MNSDFWKIFLFTTTILSLNAAQYRQFKAETQKLFALINHNIENQVFSKTLRIVSHGNFKSTSEINLLAENHIPLVIGDNKPIIQSLDPKWISTGRKTGFHEMFKYVVVIFITNQNVIKESIESIRTTVNRRWDKIIIASPEKQILEKIISYEATQDLKEKFLFNLKTGEIWTDPFIYNKGKMIAINSLAENPLRLRMGGNLAGRHLKVAGTEFPPFMFKTTHENGSITYSGVNVNIVEVSSLKFNYTYTISYDWDYGEFWPNGSWTGMYAKIFYPEQEHHFAMGLTYEYVWYYGVDYATITDSINIMFATNQPQTKLEWYAFLLPFSFTVWLWVIITYIVLGTVQFIVMYFIHDKRLKYIVWESGIFLPYAMATEQGLVDVPKGARYLSLIWLVGCLVLSTGYKSTLRNRLSFPTPEKIPVTFGQLADSWEYGITLFSSGSTEKAIIQGSPTHTMYNIRRRMKYSENLDQCLRDVYQNPHTSCIGWNCLLQYVTARSLTVNLRVPPLVFSKDTPKMSYLSVPFQRDSIFVDAYSRITESVFESGLIEKWKSEEDYKAKLQGIERLGEEKQSKLYRLLMVQTQLSESDRKPLTLMNLKVIFAILPVGEIVALGLFLIERVNFKQKIQYAYCCSGVSRKY